MAEIVETTLFLVSLCTRGPAKLVVSFGRLTTFYVVLVPMELIPSKPPHGTYIIVSFCTLQKGSNF